MSLFHVSDVIITWLDTQVEPSLQFNVIQELLQCVHFQKCVILDSFPWSQRAGLEVSNMQLFTVPSSVNNYLTGFGAELFTFVYTDMSVHL